MLNLTYVGVGIYIERVYMSVFEQKDRKRLSIDIPRSLYAEMWKSSFDRNCTLTKWVIRAVVQELRKEDNRNESKNDN